MISVLAFCFALIWFLILIRSDDYKRVAVIITAHGAANLMLFGFIDYLLSVHWSAVTVILFFLDFAAAWCMLDQRVLPSLKMFGEGIQAGIYIAAMVVHLVALWFADQDGYLEQYNVLIATLTVAQVVTTWRGAVQAYGKVAYYPRIFHRRIGR